MLLDWPVWALDRAGIAHPGWATTQGGRILRVDTLAADGPGSLCAALEAQEPRIVVFEVGGVIYMAGTPLFALGGDGDMELFM